MNDNWQVIFFAGAPMWQYGPLIKALQAPEGTRIPMLMCSAVVPGQNGFVELTVAEEGTTPVLTLLVRQEHVMCAIRLRQQSRPGFAMPEPLPESYMEPMASDARPNAHPSQPGG